MFSLFSEFISSTEHLNTQEVFPCSKLYIEALQKSCDDYFPESSDVRSGNLWVIDPFLPCENHNLSLSQQEKLIELSCDEHLKAVKSDCNNMVNF